MALAFFFLALMLPTMVVGVALDKPWIGMVSMGLFFASTLCVIGSFIRHFWDWVRG